MEILNNLNQSEVAFLMGVATGYFMAALVVWWFLVVRKNHDA